MVSPFPIKQTQPHFTLSEVTEHILLKQRLQSHGPMFDYYYHHHHHHPITTTVASISIIALVVLVALVILYLCSCRK
jgi:hypothetical protein